MASITATITDVSKTGDGSALQAVWTPVTEADSCVAIKVPQYTVKSVQVAGDFGSSSTAVQGSIDGTNYAALTDQANSAVAITSAAIKQVQQNAYYLKPVTTGGTSQSLTISMLLVRI